MSKIGLDAQIVAVELEILSRRGHVDNLRRLVRTKQRQESHVEEAQKNLPALEAALDTLKWLKNNKEKILKKMADSS